MCAAVALAVQAQVALAQTTQTPPPAKSADTSPAPAKDDAKKSDKDVVVTAKAPTYQSSIDRKSYSIAGDLQKSTGSLADALRNVPSVEVDLQGKVTVRGQSVTILVDGQPSALFKGPTQADAVQQLSADQYERVEVMTNPSAAFKPDGAGGIINLVSKKKRTAGHTGSVRVNIGNDGRYNASISDAHTWNGLTVTANGGFRRFRSDSHSSSSGTITDPASGDTAQTAGQGGSRFDNRSVSGGLNVEYALDKSSKITGGVNASHFEAQGRTTGSYATSAVSGPLATAYDYAGEFGFKDSFASASAGYIRTFPGDDHQFSANFSLTRFKGSTDNTESYSFRQPSVMQQFLSEPAPNDTTFLDGKIEYKRPLPGKAKLVTGYELEYERDLIDRRQLVGTSAADAVINPAQTDEFKADQAVHAFYVTYQRPFGALTVMPGLRLEETVIELDQVTQTIKDNLNQFAAYPTLHLAYKLDDNQTLTASYSRRVQRPGLSQRDPFRVVNGPLSLSQGNPDLKPQTTEAFEAGYEYRKGGASYQANLYYKDNHDLFTNVTENLGGGVLLSTQQNLGHNRNAGLELVAAGQFTKTLTYSASGNVYWTQYDAQPPNILATSGVVGSGRGTLTWTISPKDVMQFNALLRSRQINPQGSVIGFNMLNVGYQHKIDDRLAFVATAQDALGTASRYTFELHTPTVSSVSHSHNNNRTLYLGFTYALGTVAKARPPSFDFNGGAGGPGGH